MSSVSSVHFDYLQHLGARAALERVGGGGRRGAAFRVNGGGNSGSQATASFRGRQRINHRRMKSRNCLLS